MSVCCLTFSDRVGGCDRESGKPRCDRTLSDIPRVAHIDCAIENLLLQFLARCNRLSSSVTTRIITRFVCVHRSI